MLFRSRTIRVPVHMSDRLRQIYKTSQQLEQRLGRAPTPEEIAEDLQLDISKLRWMLQVAQPTLSLESPVNDDEEDEMGLYVEDQNSPSPAQITYENMLRERVEEVLSTLGPREARVLRLRFGLGQDRSYTLEEVGQKFGLTRERIQERYRTTAEHQVRRHLILDKIIRQEGLTLSDEAIEAGMAAMAEAYNQPIEGIKGYYTQNPERLEGFKHALLEKEAIKIIMDNSQIETVAPETDPIPDSQ